MMGKKGDFSIGDLSAPAVAVLMAAFLIVINHPWWGAGFILLALILGTVKYW